MTLHAMWKGQNHVNTQQKNLYVDWQTMTLCSINNRGAIPVSSSQLWTYVHEQHLKEELSIKVKPRIQASCIKRCMSVKVYALNSALTNCNSKNGNQVMRQRTETVKTFNYTIISILMQTIRQQLPFVDSIPRQRTNEVNKNHTVYHVHYIHKIIVLLLPHWEVGRFIFMNAPFPKPSQQSIQPKEAFPGD